MSNGHRLALVGLAALVAILALVLLRPGEEPAGSTSSTTAEVEGTTGAPSGPAGEGTGSQPTVAAPARERAPAPPLLSAGSGRTVVVKEGEVVRFRVRHSQTEEVHVHGYDIARDLPADRTVTLSFPATIEGIFEIELERSGVPLGELRVEP